MNTQDAPEYNQSNQNGQIEEVIRDQGDADLMSSINDLFQLSWSGIGGEMLRQSIDNSLRHSVDSNTNPRLMMQQFSFNRNDSNGNDLMMTPFRDDLITKDSNRDDIYDLSALDSLRLDGSVRQGYGDLNGSLSFFHVLKREASTDPKQGIYTDKLPDLHNSLLLQRGFPYSETASKDSSNNHPKCEIEVSQTHNFLSNNESIMLPSFPAVSLDQSYMWHMPPPSEFSPQLPLRKISPQNMFHQPPSTFLPCEPVPYRPNNGGSTSIPDITSMEIPDAPETSFLPPQPIFNTTSYMSAPMQPLFSTGSSLMPTESLMPSSNMLTPTDDETMLLPHSGYSIGGGTCDEKTHRGRRSRTEYKKVVQMVAEVDGKMVVSVVPNMKEPKASRRWTANEDELLRLAVEKEGTANWVEISKHVPNRDNTQCMQRYHKVLKPGIKKGSWSKEEDEILLTAVQQLGTDSWDCVCELLPGRSNSKCRERYMNYIGPNVRKGHWTSEEDNMIISLQSQWGNKWSAIAKQLLGRTSNDVKSRFKTLLRINKPTVGMIKM